ncbi:MAG: hypothetical protein H5T69_17915, partial [Chloroflexi bacterium]|nr:hypothetical protein [Chloroflexota bacterium]
MRIGKLAMVALVFVLLLGACEMPLGTPTPALGATPVVEQRVPTAPPSGAPQMGPSPTQSSPTNPAPAMAEPTRPVAQATATNAPPPAAQGVVDEQGRLLFSRASDLSKLNSYRVHHTWNYRWAKGINSGVTEILVEFVREPYAERVVIIRDKKESSRQELIRVNGVTYMLTPDGWQTMKAETPLFPPEADPRIGMLP